MRFGRGKGRLGYGKTKGKFLSLNKLVAWGQRLWEFGESVFAMDQSCFTRVPGSLRAGWRVKRCPQIFCSKFSVSLLYLLKKKKRLHRFFHPPGSPAQSLFFHSKLRRRAVCTHWFHNLTFWSHFTLFQAVSPLPITQQKGFPVRSLMMLINPIGIVQLQPSLIS